MNIEDYYTNKFPIHLKEWLKSSNAHPHGDEGVYISSGYLTENISHIPKEQLDHFYITIAFTILLDQLVYSYFKKDYPYFQKLTQYPKIEYGITNMNVRPWDIVNGVNTKLFIDFSNFFIKEFKDFFTKYTFEEATWEKIVKIMISDKDITKGRYGSAFIITLKKTENINE